VASAREAEQALFLAYRRDGNREAREALIERFLPLARRLAARYQRRGEDLDDLVQVALLALVKAVDGFHPERGVAFTSYAVPTIVGELKRHFRDRTWAVHVPRDLQERALKVASTATHLEARLGRAPTARELGDKLGVSIEEVLEASQAAEALGAESLNRPLAGDEPEGDSVLDQIGVVDDGYGRVEAGATLERYLAVLDERSREVLRLRFEEDLSQQEIAQMIGCSQMHVSRLIRQAVERLQKLAAHAERQAELRSNPAEELVGAAQGG
jgi:RNA polymerase sigma-B factor